MRVIHGQTDLIDHGIGAHAARATGLTGGAVHVTAMMVREKALEFASELLQTPAAELDIVDGTVTRKNGRGGPSITLAEIAKRIAPGSKLSARTRAAARRARLVQHAAHGLSLRGASRRGAGRPRHRQDRGRALHGGL